MSEVSERVLALSTVGIRPTRSPEYMYPNLK